MASSLFLAAFIMLASSRLSTKQLYVIRHGQAFHNPRAEAARSAGCSYQEFLELMRQDDVLDAPLTPLGKQQALEITGPRVDLVVSSPLSRALETADLALPKIENRICIEDFREINGWLLNAKRKSTAELEADFCNWNFALDSTMDELWTPELETNEDASERGYRGFRWIMNRPEESIALVGHGGILSCTMKDHPRISVQDGRNGNAAQKRAVDARFGNCEVRRYEMSWDDVQTRQDGIEKVPTIKLIEMDL